LEEIHLFFIIKNTKVKERKCTHSSNDKF